MAKGHISQIFLRYSVFLKITSHKARQMKKMTWAAAELGIAVVENKKKMSKVFFCDCPPYPNRI